LNVISNDKNNTVCRRKLRSVEIKVCTNDVFPSVILVLLLKVCSCKHGNHGERQRFPNAVKVTRDVWGVPKVKKWASFRQRVEHFGVYACLVM